MLHARRSNSKLRRSTGSQHYNILREHGSIAEWQTHAEYQSFLSSTIEGRDHRDDVDQLIALDKVALEDANLLQLHTLVELAAVLEPGREGQHA